MKLNLTYVKSEQRMSKANKPYTSQSIKAAEYGERYLSGFGSKETMNWKVGDIVEVDVKESDKLDKNGKPYLNWSIEKAESPVMVRVNQLEFRLAKHDTQIKELQEFIRGKFGNSNGTASPVGLTSAGTKVPDWTPNTPQEADTFAGQMLDYEEENGILNAMAEEEIR